MKKIRCLFAIAILFSVGCSQLKVLESPQPSEESVAQGTTTATEQATKQLPTEAGSTAAFQQIEPSIRKLAPTTNLTDLKKDALRQKLTGVLITHCELEHVKALVAIKRAPIVVVKSSEGNLRLWVVTGYNDEGEQITLTNPLRKETTQMKYAEFEPAWKDAETPQRVLLLSARSIKSKQVRTDLAKYLPEAKLANLTFQD